MRKAILIIFFLFTIFPFACKKYEEGPLISFRTRWNRIKGHHTLTEYRVNGIDCTNSYKDSLGTDFYFYEKDSDPSWWWTISGMRNDGKEIQIIYEISNNFTTGIPIIGGGGGGQGIGPFAADTNVFWKLVKLEKKDIRIKTVYNSKEYYIILSTK